MRSRCFRAAWFFFSSRRRHTRSKRDGVQTCALPIYKDDKGLYVSTGGFTKDAHYEAERSTIPLTLMDLDELAKEIAEHYEKMDPEARALLPLRRIYWPTSLMCQPASGTVSIR